MRSLLSEHLSQVEEAAEWLEKNLEPSPEVAIIGGSAGPRNLGDYFEGDPFSESAGTELGFPPSLPKPKLDGHKAAMRVGVVNETSVLWVKGRVHFNESPDDPYRHTAMTRALGRSGIKNLILTNAVGSLKPKYDPGTVCVIADHNSKFMGHSPLAGDPSLLKSVFGTAHVGMNPIYDARFQELALRATYDGKLKGGVRTLMVPGPEFESAMEAAMFAPLTDVIGMSSIPEAMVARQLQMRVLMLSFVTNMIPTEVILDPEAGVSHSGNLDAAQQKDVSFCAYLAEVVGLMGKDLRGELAK